MQISEPGLIPPPPIGALDQGTIAFCVRFLDLQGRLEAIGIPIFCFGTGSDDPSPWNVEIHIGHGEQFVSDDRRLCYTVHEPKTDEEDGKRIAPLCFNTTERQDRRAA